MRHDRLEHPDLDHAPRDEPGLGAPAGVFLLAGRFHVAAFATRDARLLRDRGALLVAALRFEREHAGDPTLPLQPLRAPGDLPRLGGPSGRN
jgi:hypothetical protein